MKVPLFQPSVEYKTWRRQFIGNRLRLGLWLAIACHAMFASINFSRLVLWPDREAQEQALKLFGDPVWFERLKQFTLWSDWVTMALLGLVLMVWHTKWGRHRPRMMFLATFWAMALAPQMVGTLMGLPVPTNWTFIFMAIVIVIPVHWQLHLFAQAITALYYFGVNPILGLIKIPGFINVFDIELVIGSLWIMVICNIAVYVYDHLQYREFESRRELRLFIHAVTHDLRIPVLGTSVVLEALLRKAQNNAGQATIRASKIQQLLAGNDRQLSLINSILTAHRSDSQGITLNCQPLQLGAIVTAVLEDSESLLAQNQVTVINRLTSDLPFVHGDAEQLWRLYSNLIANALTHNPAGIEITLDAVTNHANQLYCTVQDSGVGIPKPQQQRLFDLYYRGEESQYAPGLGLGLYLCRQIILAHGGNIGIISQSGQGSLFWFTLPRTV